MAYSFSGATDRITTSYTAHTSAISILATFFRTGGGGGGNGSVLVRGGGVLYTILSWSNTSSLMLFGRRFSGLQTWSISGTASTNTVYRVAISHGGPVGDLPTVFVNGTQATATVVTASSGNLNTTATAVNIGNGSNDTRNWAGWIAEVAYYNAQLDSKFLQAYSNSWSPKNFLPNRTSYLELLRDAADAHKGAVTVTGAVSTSSHPAMFNPAIF